MRRVPSTPGDTMPTRVARSVSVMPQGLLISSAALMMGSVPARKASRGTSATCVASASTASPRVTPVTVTRRVQHQAPATNKGAASVMLRDSVLAR